jgi:hypothetical protein
MATDSRFVTVASFTSTVEAQLAKNLLESSGIAAFLAGELTANTLTGLFGGTHLQVHEENAQRAVALLAVASAQVSLDEDWEAKAEQGLWTCSVCGTAIPLGKNICPSCGTSNAGIITDRRDTIPAPKRPPEADQVKKSDQIQAEAPRALVTTGEEDEQPVPRSPGCILLSIPLLLVVWLLVAFA